MTSQFYMTYRLGHYQVLPLRVKVDKGAKATNGYSIFPKVSELESHRQMVYSTAPADWA